MKNVLWYTRDGHLELFALLSKRLQSENLENKSYFVCHNKKEHNQLSKSYSIHSTILSEYIKTNKKENISNELIRKLESKYKNIPLRKLLWSEMYEFSFTEEEMICNLVEHINFWEKYLFKHSINAVVSERPSILSTNVLWMLCDHYDIPFVDFLNIGINGRVVFSSSWYGDIEDFESSYKTCDIDKKSATYKNSKSYLKRMNLGPQKPKYISQNLITGEGIKKNQLYQISYGGSPLKFPKLNKIGTWIKNKQYRKEYYINTTIFDVYKIWIKTVSKHIIHKFYNIFDKNIDPQNEQYFLFPLHILHEWSNYPWMDLKYPNMINVIKECASCLPIGCKLYVKEHTSNFPEKRFSFYNEIKNISNVKLIDRNENTFELLKNSEAIITIGGTIGWEAYLLGKPVIILGKAWYRCLTGIYKSVDIEHLVNLLQNAANLKTASNEEKLQAIYTLYDLSFDAVRYPIIDLISTDNIDKYVGPLKKWFDKY